MFDHHASLDRATVEGCRGLVDEVVQKGTKSVALLVADGAGLDLEKLVAGLCGVSAEVMGGVFPGLIVDRRLLKEGALALGFSDGAKRVVFRDLGGPAAQLENQMSGLYSAAKHARAHSVLLFLDGVAGAPYTGRFTEALQLYFHVSAKYVGGGAGRRDLARLPCLFTEAEVLPLGAGMALRLDRELAVSYRHGWTKLAGPFFVSRSQGNCVLELDWRPAAEVYEEALRAAGKISTSLSIEFDRVAPLHPLGLLKLGELLVVRDPISSETDGGLVTFGKIPQHSVLSILKGEPDALLSATRQVAEEVRGILQNDRSTPHVFVADCMTRETALGPRFAEELGVLGDSFGEHVAGALTVGEVASGRDRFVDFFNKTIVLGAR